jgi:hypothetical protein
MADALVAALLPFISPVRLEAHRPSGGSDLDMVIIYLWNVELCEALYPAIHAFEISLRNSIHVAASHHYRTPFWFDEPDVLLAGQRELIQEARDKLVARRKPQDPDDIVAALTLGFWVSLFNSPFESPLPPAPRNQLAWHDQDNRPTTLFLATFPHAPNPMKSRKKISRRCNSILALRNRVMHHETIWKYANLPRRHAEILDMIGWISPAMRSAIGLCDDFPVVHAAGKVRIKAELMALLGIR